MEEALEQMPLLKQLLINYILFNYEEEAQTEPWHLVQEYLLLKREDRLHELFVQQYLDNTGTIEGVEWL